MQKTLIRALGGRGEGGGGGDLERRSNAGISPLECIAEVTAAFIVQA